MIELIFYSLVGGLFSLVGGFLVIWQANFAKKSITVLLSFAAGAFLAAAFLDLLPEVLEATTEPHPVLLSTLLGFLAFFILERLLMKYLYGKHTHTDPHSDHTESLPFLLVLGDSIHNFLDGVVIGLAYLTNPTLGLVTTLAIAAHEIPQEIGDFSVLLHLGWPKSKVISVNVLQSLLTIPGAFLGFYAGQLLEAYLPYILASTAGIFIYIAASDLIPEIHHHSGHKHLTKVVVPMLISIFLVWYLVGLAHH